MADSTVSQVAPFVNENSMLHIDFLNGQTPVVSSLDVARHFQRRHSHILRDIGRLCSILPKSFNQPNFGRVEIPDVKGEKRPAYLLTRDAFSLLVMGMTGKAAIQWKLRYIEAFNALEAAALDRQAELAREAGYRQGREETLALPAVKKERQAGYLAGMKEGEKLQKGRDQRSFTYWATLWLSECWRVARDGSPLPVFTDWRQLPTLTDAIQAAGWLWRGVVVWQKPSARPMIGEFRREAEFLVYGSKGKPHAHTRHCFPGVFKYAVNTAAKVHITGKPLALLQDLMGIVAEGGTVLDHFLGGGTTAHAALLTGRKCIGVELSPDYAKLSAQRLLEVE